MRRHWNWSQLKEQDKTEIINNETKVNNLSDKELKALVIRMLSELGDGIDEHSENFNKELENIKKNQSKMKNTITEMKNLWKELKNRPSDTE